MNKSEFINRVNELKEELRKIKNSSFNFPIAMKVSAKSIALDLVPVKPMSKPKYY